MVGGSSEEALGGYPVKRPSSSPLNGGPGMILQVKSPTTVTVYLRQDHVRIQFFCHLSPVQQRPKQSLLRKVQNGLRQQSWAESTKSGIAQLVNEEVRLSIQDFYSIQPFFRASGAASRFSSVLQVRSTPDQWLLAVFTTVIAF